MVTLNMRLIRFSISEYANCFSKRPVFPAFFVGGVQVSLNPFIFAAIVAVAYFCKGMLW